MTRQYIIFPKIFEPMTDLFYFFVFFLKRGCLEGTAPLGFATGCRVHPQRTERTVTLANDCRLYLLVYTYLPFFPFFFRNSLFFIQPLYYFVRSIFFASPDALLGTIRQHRVVAGPAERPHRRRPPLVIGSLEKADWRLLNLSPSTV